MIEKLIAEDNIIIKRGMTPNMRMICRWIEEKFGEGWASECQASFTRHPSSVFVAAADGKDIIGFACYDATAKGYFGPTGVDPEYRGKGVGTALLYKCLEALKNEGYGYAIIGGAGPIDFYRKSCGAMDIPVPSPNIYSNMLR
ncbi:hypothetical protein SDC9_196745 [bioreactor metagenome]|uniref:N-acetyltransferase domain-containing protein n=1 Tax=bioreactor metagenome TaxID=1076179 RepID=A0A645IE68_9ZZZZ